MHSAISKNFRDVRDAITAKGTSLKCQACKSQIGDNFAMQGVSETLIQALCEGFDEDGNPIPSSDCALIQRS